MRLEDVETPALIIDLPAFERNIRRMSDAVRHTKIMLRPHAKAHKSPAVAMAQMRGGATGICCQKVSEAEAMVAGGVLDILLTNEVVDPGKLRRLARLARTAHIAICVDDVAQVPLVDAAAAAEGVRLEVLVELDVGHHRCGAAAGEVSNIASAILRSPCLTFSGLQAYHGAAQHFRAPSEREAAIRKAVELVREAQDQLAAIGLPAPRVTGAGTGSFEYELASGVYTELQPGSYVFMDADYGKNLDRNGQAARTFENSLFVLATVMSVAGRSHVVLDAGLKATTAESGLPRVYGRAHLEAVGMSDEHTKVEAAPGGAVPQLGDKLLLVPGHVDPTVNLHDWYVGVRDGMVECLWPITARGPGF